MLPGKPSSVRLLRRAALTIATLVLACAGLFAMGPRNTMGPAVATVRELPPADIALLEPWLQHAESAYTDIKPGNAKGIVWYDAPRRKTPWAIVYIHGFSASRIETAPLTQTIAGAMGANVFYTRLAGHGRSGDAMLQSGAQDWMADVVEAVQIGKTLGDRVVMVSCSTGSTLATWLALSPRSAMVDAHVFISPNFGPKDKRSDLINGPWGRQIAMAIAGPSRGWTPASPAEANGWTTRYPTPALFPMMGLVQAVRDADLTRFQTPLLVLYSPRDTVVDPLLTEAAFARIGSARKTMVAVDYSDNAEQHVLAGDIKAPAATGRMADSVVQWLHSLSREGN